MMDGHKLVGIMVVALAREYRAGLELASLMDGRKRVVESVDVGHGGVQIRYTDGFMEVLHNVPVVALWEKAEAPHAEEPEMVTARWRCPCCGKTEGIVWLALAPEAHDLFRCSCGAEWTPLGEITKPGGDQCQPISSDVVPPAEKSAQSSPAQTPINTFASSTPPRRRRG